MALTIPKDFSEFIELLNANEVDYLVIGGYAVNAHGYNRYTRDIDFWIWMSPNNLTALTKSLNEFGFASLRLSEEDFKDPKAVVQLGYEPHRIDLLVDVDGLDFRECFTNRATENVDGVDIHFIGKQDLIRAKDIAARPKDIADAHTLRTMDELKEGKKGKP